MALKEYREQADEFLDTVLRYSDRKTIGIPFAKGTVHEVYKQEENVLKIKHLFSLYSRKQYPEEKEIQESIQDMPMLEGSELEQSILRKSLVQAIYDKKMFEQIKQEEQYPLLVDTEYKIIGIETIAGISYRPAQIQKFIEGESLDTILQPVTSISTRYDIPIETYMIEGDKKQRDNVEKGLLEAKRLYKHFLEKETIIDMTLRDENETNPLLHLFSKAMYTLTGRGEIRSNFIFDGKCLRLIDVETTPYTAIDEFRTHIFQEQLKRTIEDNRI